MCEESSKKEENLSCEYKKGICQLKEGMKAPETLCSQWTTIGRCVDSKGAFCKWTPATCTSKDSDDDDDEGDVSTR